jgi:hypothetical protein
MCARVRRSAAVVLAAVWCVGSIGCGGGGGQTVELTVTEGGAPLTQDGVSVTLDGGGTSASGTAKDGKVKLSGLTPGSYTVRATKYPSVKEGAPPPKSPPQPQHLEAAGPLDVTAGKSSYTIDLHKKK